jgi:hypothetical protein
MKTDSDRWQRSGDLSRRSVAGCQFAEAATDDRSRAAESATPDGFLPRGCRDFGLISIVVDLAPLSHADDAMLRRSPRRMTLEQLKRHMDRRLDRLQRTKADKADLKRFATKSQFRRLLKDLSNRPTKDDLKRELARYATKDDLAQLATRVDRNTAEMNRQFDSLNDKIDGGLQAVLHRLEQLGDLQERMYREHGDRLRDLEQRVGL